MINKKMPLLRWGVAALGFLAMAMMSLSLLFSPAVQHVRTPLGKEYTSSGSALTNQGMSLRAQAWTEYPVYNSGLFVLMMAGFMGFLWSAWSGIGTYQDMLEQKKFTTPVTTVQPYKPIGRIEINRPKGKKK